MGWERKRGKIEEFNALLRGATDTGYVVQVGALDVLPSVRYCLTLDRDTFLPRDAAKKLIGIIAHPAQPPARRSAWSGRVVQGYGILQPRVSVTMASALGSTFARTYAGHTGVDPYTTAVSDVYQDIFDEGIFTGKGLYEVDAFRAVLEGRVPENTLLSHDLFEGLLRAHGARLRRGGRRRLPVERARRTHAGSTAGCAVTGRSCSGCFPLVRTREGLERNRLPAISRWKIVDNLRRSLVGPATVALFVAGWIALPGRPWIWTIAALAAVGFPLYQRLAEVLAGPARAQRWSVFWRTAAENIRTAAIQCALHLTFLANQAAEMVHAIGITLVRLAITRRRLLEWETAESVARRERSSRQFFFSQMVASPAVALGALTLVLIKRPSALAVALPFVVLWTMAPMIAFWLSRPDRAPAAESQRGRPRSTSRASRDRRGDTSTSSSPHADHHLPPDNVQFTPEARVARRTSPTNIAMALLSTLAAYDLGFIDVALARHAHHQHADDARGDGAPRGPLAELVRHRDARAAQSGVRLDGRQRQPGRRVRRPRRRPARGRRGRRRPVSRHVRADRARTPCRSHRRGSSTPCASAFSTTGRDTCSRSGTGWPTPRARDASTPPATTCSRPRRESRASSPSRRATCRRAHWFHLGRSVTSVRGVPVLISWSGSLFEYLMPLLLMRQLSGHAARRVVPPGPRAADRIRRRASTCRGASPSPPTT